jgi:hypothetical protein
MKIAIEWVSAISRATQASLPRRHVLRGTGATVELLAIESQGDVQRVLVELADGHRLLAKLEDIQSRPAIPGFFIGACLALALAGILAGMSLQPPVTLLVITEAAGPPG